MAKKQIKKFTPRTRQEKLNLIKSKKKFVLCAFRLGVQDKQNLAKIADEMNNYAMQKQISLTDAIKALIRHGLKLNKRQLIKDLGENL